MYDRHMYDNRRFSLYPLDGADDVPHSLSSHPLSWTLDTHSELIVLRDVFCVADGTACSAFVVMR